jgi:RNA polymerase sigma-70 factor (ECF subfamily)
VKSLALALTASLAVLFGAASADELTVKTAPPVVVKTVPEAGATEVDPKTAEIKVMFSKDMQDKSWSWSSASENTFPRTDGNPSYEKDKRTAVMPVKLDPGKTYAIWVNSENHANFKDTDGRSAVPYLLVFQTKK